MGRPRLPEDQRPVKHQVRLTAAVSDEVYRLATARGLSQYAFLGGLIERIIREHEKRTLAPTCYGAEQPSTLSRVLSDSSSTRT